jgi:hypothetical protein
MSAALVGCSNRADVSDALRELIFERKMKTIRLVDATRFVWDQAYFFGPYTPRSEVCRTLGIQEKRCKGAIPFESEDDGVMSIAFLADGRLVHYARHTRGNGDFVPMPVHPLGPETAVFSAVPDDAKHTPQPWIRLVLR